MFKTFVTATVAMALGAGAAGAATLTLVGNGASATLPPGFSLDSSLSGLGITTPVDAWLLTGATKSDTDGLFIDGPARIAFTYLGAEAGARNAAVFAGPGGETTLFTKASAAGEVSPEFDVGIGLLPILFRTSLGGGGEIANHGGATSTALKLAYALLGPTAALVFFDDGPTDGDLDDLAMLVQISPDNVSQVPLPAPLFLLGMSLAGLGAFSLRRGRRS